MQSQLCGNHGQFVEALILDIREASAFPDVSASVTCRSQLCINHGQFVEVPIPDIEEALAFPNVSAPVTCTLSLAKITGNLSKISGDVEST
ncbi:hypothetical protein ACFX1Z_000401 [Malus domestica]